VVFLWLELKVKTRKTTYSILRTATEDDNLHTESKIFFANNLPAIYEPILLASGEYQRFELYLEIFLI